MKRKRKKFTYKRSIIVGFLSLYFMSMLLSTYFVEVKYEKEYNSVLYELKDRLYTTFYTLDESYGANTKESREKLKHYAMNELAQMPGADKYQQFSAALFHMDGELIAMTSNTFGQTVEIQLEDSTWQEYQYYRMEDYLTEEEIQKLSYYYSSDSPLFQQRSEDEIESAEIKRYALHFLYDEEKREPAVLYMVESVIGPNSYGGFYNKLSPEPVWAWYNKDFKVEAKDLMYSISGETGVSAYFPYSFHGTKQWEKWRQDEWLQSLRDYDIKAREEDTEYDGIQRQHSQMIAVAGQTSGFCKLIIRQTAHPWLAAMNYMKYVYLMGALLTLVCIIKVIYSTGKTYKEKEALEEMRRDFTNAAAHELKTPLSVIRGFAENLKENTVEEKRDYYLDQIILQTEQMDELVKQMIQVSKMDSDRLNLEKENLSMTEIIKSQMKKFEPFVEEKNLKIIYETEEDFILEGDRIQAERMIWNLLSNGIEYNRPDGSIWIMISRDRIAIENSGEPIPKEKLPYIFDVFYRGDESRQNRSEHMGLGLYLANKISEMHGLSLTICNTDAGVRAAIHRRKR